MDGRGLWPPERRTRVHGPTRKDSANPPRRPPRDGTGHAHVRPPGADPVRSQRRLPPGLPGVRQFRSHSTARGRTAHLTAFFGRAARAAALTTHQIRQYQLARRASRGVASPNRPRHHHRPGTPLRGGDCRSAQGKHPAAALPPPADPILEQHPGAGSSSDQTTSEGQAGRSCIPRGAANDPGRRGQAHDPEGAGDAGERFGCSATDSVHQHAVRGGCMRRNPGDSTNRSLAAF